MQTIEINKDELHDLKRKFEHLAERREEHNQKLSNLIENLSNVESSGFVEEIIEKLEDHIFDVNQNQIGNLTYSADFLSTLIEEFSELDKNIIK